MSIKNYITDKKSGISADVIKKEACDCQALAVATVPFVEYENAIEFFTNDTYGANMNQSLSSGTVATEYIYDADEPYWTASDIVGGGKTTFVNNDQNHTDGGAFSAKIVNSPVGDVFQFAKGSDMNLNNFVLLSMWVYVDKDWKAGDDIRVYGWDVDTNAQVGISVGLQNYFGYLTYKVWQKIVIPLTDMEIDATTTLDALRVVITSKERKSAKFYLDDIQFESAGAPLSYELKAKLGTWLHVYNYTISVADALASTLADATMPNIAYDNFLGETLTTGMSYQRIQDGKTTFSLQVKTMLDLLQLSGTRISGQGSDGTNTWITIVADFTEPLILKSEDDDTLKFIVNDDMSGLLHFRISAGCKVETR